MFGKQLALQFLPVLGFESGFRSADLLQAKAPEVALKYPVLLMELERKHYGHT